MTISKRRLVVILVVAIAWQAQSHAIVQDVTQTQSPDLALDRHDGQLEGFQYPSAPGSGLNPPVPDQVPTAEFAFAQPEGAALVLVDDMPQTAQDRGDKYAFPRDLSAAQQFPLYVSEELGARTLVPLPGAVWLLFSALGLAGLLRGRRRET